MTPAAMRDVLVQVVAAQVRQAKRHGDHRTARGRARVLRELGRLPVTDPRLVALAGYPVAWIAAAIPDDTVIPAGSAGQFLDSLTAYMEPPRQPVKANGAATVPAPGTVSG